MSLDTINLKEKELDDHIYRIMPEAYVLDMFSGNSNVLTQVHKWKDKFENFLLNAGRTLKGQKFEYDSKNDFVGQCWTKNQYSEAMWGIYANDPNERFLRIRTTPRILIKSLTTAHPDMPQDTCFIGAVEYKREEELRTFLDNFGNLQLSSHTFAESLFLKRRAFKHENEVRLLYLGDEKNYTKGLYSYPVNPHTFITQIMADPNRDRKSWNKDKELLQQRTQFKGAIKRSKIYDPPKWKPRDYNS